MAQELNERILLLMNTNRLLPKATRPLFCSTDMKALDGSPTKICPGIQKALMVHPSRESSCT